MLAIGLVIIAVAWVDRKNTEYVITSKAVYKKRGAISRSVHRIPFEKIQNTSLSQGVLGTYYDYGSVEISTAGSEGAEMRFRAVPDPRDVQDQLNRMVRRTGPDEQPEDSQGRDTEAVLTELLTEVRIIREALTDGEQADVVSGVEHPTQRPDDE